MLCAGVRCCAMLGCGGIGLSDTGILGVSGYLILGYRWGCVWGFLCLKTIYFHCLRMLFNRFQGLKMPFSLPENGYLPFSGSENGISENPVEGTGRTLPVEGTGLPEND